LGGKDSFKIVMWRFGKFKYCLYICRVNQNTDDMKTMKINENLSLKIHEGGQMYDVVIDNETKEVVYHSSEFSPIPREVIQKMVEKLMRLDMIHLIGENTTNVSINIWEIDETENQYIETFHVNPDLPDNELFDDYDRTMLYEEFLNS